MRRILTLGPLLALVGLAALILWLWPLGGMAELTRWAAEGQREVQSAMAGVLRRLKAGDPAALSALLGLCFAYGFFHAAGPGHGKLLIGGYGLGRRVPVLRLSGLAVVSSLAQAGTAVLLVWAGTLVLDWTRDQMVDMAERVLAPVSYGFVALLGLFLLLRGVGRLRRAVHERSAAHRDHACGCGHHHGPTAEQAARAGTLREAVSLVAAVAVRPCTGAIFVLIVAWRMDLGWIGPAGAFVMGLGTASVTVAVAVAAALMRESALHHASTPRTLALSLPALELLAGAVIALVAAQLAVAAL